MKDSDKPPSGCGESRKVNPDGSVHVTRWTPNFRRSLDIAPDGSIRNDHIGPNSGRQQGSRVPFRSPYDRWDPR